MSKVSEQDYIDYLELINDGYSQRKAAKILGIARTTLQDYIKRKQKEQASETKEIKFDISDSFKALNSGISAFAKALSINKSKIDSSLNKYHSNEHGKEFDDFDLFEEQKPISKKPRVLYYDIETSLAKSYHFQQWKVNLSQKHKIQESHLLSHAWAWNDGEVHSSILTQEEMLNHDPERLVLECWSLFDHADIVVAHNGKRFDIKKVNSYFLQYGLPEPSPYKVIDTLLIAKQKFALPFNSLAYLAEFLNVEQKLETGGIDLWIECDKGNQEALNTMEDYNRGDIITLRSVYNRLIGWSNDGVNVALYSDHGASCPHCSSEGVSVIQGKYSYTVSRKYQVYRCNSCGAVLRSNRKEGSGNSLVRVVS